jgi:hypothetical protein
MKDGNTISIKEYDMIDKLFDYAEGYECVTDMGLQFYIITLKVAVGPHEAGETFEAVYVDFDTGVIALYSKGKEVYKGELELRVL